MNDSPKFSIVKVLYRNYNVAGAGFLIGKKWVLTCRHVIENVLPNDKKDDDINLTFYLDESKKIHKSHILFLADIIEPDIAILELEDEAPSCASIAKLIVTNNFWDRDLKVCGFSSGEDGEWVKAVGRESRDPNSIQIDVEGTCAYTIEMGFSGAPVFDAECNDIVGIIINKEKAAGILSGSLTPVDLILDVCKKHSIDLSIFEFLSEPLAPIFGVPTLPPHYLPRKEDLEKIKELMFVKSVKPAAITSAKLINSLQGMGGMGKSVLATAFARTKEARETFRDGIFWVTVGFENPDIVGGMRLIGREFGDDPANYSSLKEAEISLSKVLYNKVCLIILDDVWKVLHATPFVNALGQRCKLLITTRNNDVVTSLGAQAHKIEAFSEPAALRLLGNWCEKEVDSLPSEAAEVARECGYLPLALSICGAMAKREISWTYILEALKEADFEFIEAQLPNYPDPNVGRALKVSVDFLSSEDPNAVLRYQELVVFPEDELVPEATIATLWEHTGNLKRRNVEKLLTKLRDRSLLRLDGEFPNRLISLHDLQFDYLRATAGDLSNLHNQLLEAYHKKCDENWSDGPNDGYFFEHLAYHMKEAGRKEELRNLLLDFKWMSNKLKKVCIIQKYLGEKPDVNSLLHDYDYLFDETEIRLVQDAIKLSFNAIVKDKTQLAGQLLGRLLCFQSERIQALLSQAHKCKDCIRLLPKTCSLRPPGGPLIRTLEGYSDHVHAVAITPDGKYAVSGSTDGILKVWGLKKGDEKTTLKRHDKVSAVAITPDGRCVVSASDDGILMVWDLDNGEEKIILRGHDNAITAIAITSDGKYVVSTSTDGILKVWDLEKGVEETTLRRHDLREIAVAITPDGKYAVSASEDGILKVWDLEKGEVKTTFRWQNNGVNAVAVTPDGKYIVSASTDNTLRVWDLKNGKEKTILRGHDHTIHAVAITPDGKYAISASEDGILMVWDLDNGEEKTTQKGHNDWVSAVAITPDGRYAVSASQDGTLKVWYLENGRKKATLKGQNNGVNAVAITPDGKYAVSGSTDGMLKVWDLKKGEEKTTLKGHDRLSAVAITSDRRCAVSASSNGTFRECNQRNGEKKETLKERYKGVTAIAITPDGKYAVSASSDGILKVWDLENGQKKTTLRGHSHGVLEIAITPDGKYVVSASKDGTLKVWDLKTGKEKTSLRGHDHTVHAVAITPDGKYVVSASQDKTLKVWDLDKGEEKTTLKGHDDGVTAVVITPDGRYAVSASSDKTLKVWDLENGREKATQKGHDDWMNAVSITADGKYAVSASCDKTLKVWDLEKGVIVSNFVGDSSFRALDILPNEESIVAGDALGKIHFLHLEK